MECDKQMHHGYFEQKATRDFIEVIEGMLDDSNIHKFMVRYWNC